MNELNDMTCAELADVAAELALGVLTGRERAVAIAHLDKCDECREDVRQLMATGEQLLELLPPAEPPAGFETRVLERLGLPVPRARRGAAGRTSTRSCCHGARAPGGSAGRVQRRAAPRADQPVRPRPARPDPAARAAAPGARRRRHGPRRHRGGPGGLAHRRRHGAGAPAR